MPAAGARMWIAIAAFAGLLVVGGIGLLSFPVAALCAAAVVLITRCLTPQQAYDAIDWGVLVLVGSLLGLATAMETSGAGRYFAGLLAGAAEGLGSMGLLASFYLLTVILTQPMSNQAAALVVLPLAMPAAEELGLNPRAFAAAITLAASCSFIAPLEPASLLVYGPGRYRFSDYFRVGLPLTVLTFALNMFMIPRIWPLEAPARRVASSVEIHEGRRRRSLRTIGRSLLDRNHRSEALTTANTSLPSRGPTCRRCLGDDRHHGSATGHSIVTSVSTARRDAPRPTLRHVARADLHDSSVSSRPHSTG